MSSRRFRLCSCPSLPDEKVLWDAFGLLAKWFHFPPQAIYDLDLDELELWLKQASGQIEAQNKAYEA